MLVGIRMFNPNFWYICHESYHDYLSKAQSDAMPKYWSSGSAWLALLIFGEGSEGIEDVADPIDAAQASRHTETLEHMEFQLFGSPLALGVGADTNSIQGNLLAKHSQLIEEKYFVLQQWKVQKDC